MTTPSIRALCAELVSIIEYHCSAHVHGLPYESACLQRARAAQAPCRGAGGMNYRITPVAVSIHPADKNFAFAEDSLELRITDEAGGAFFLLSQEGREPIRLELEELELLVVEARRLFSGLEGER